MPYTGLGLFGLGVVLCVLDLTTVVECVTGFGLGASSMALFGRVGGGIYTKAADVGADLVGKVEAGIPEDDPRNPAVIADNVGDNVGDVAGMGSDLFESYVGSIISAVTLAAVAAANSGGLFNETAAAMFPLVLSGIGIIASVIGIFMVRGKEGSNPANALNMGTYVSGIIVVIATMHLIEGNAGQATIMLLRSSQVWSSVLLSVKSQKFTLPEITNPLRKSQNSLRLVPLPLSSAVWA